MTIYQNALANLSKTIEEFKEEFKKCLIEYSKNRKPNLDELENKYNEMRNGYHNIDLEVIEKLKGPSISSEDVSDELGESVSPFIEDTRYELNQEYDNLSSNYIAYKTFKSRKPREIKEIIEQIINNLDENPTKQFTF